MTSPENKKIEEIAVAVNKLMPLADLVPTLQLLAKKEKDQEAMTRVMTKLGKALGFIAFVITSFSVLFGAAWYIIRLILTADKM